MKRGSRKSPKRKSSKRTSPARRKPAPAEIRLGEQVWPVERDVLFRPDRLRYVRKLVKAEGCVFCAAAGLTPTFDTLCVYRSEHSMIVLNKFPYNSGHVLVLPRRHCGDMLKLSDAEYADLGETLRLAMRAVEGVYQPGGINMGLNHGAVSGAGIPEHLHYHVIPRWAGDLNFFPLIANTKVVVESLEETWVRFQNWFSDQGGAK